MVRALISVQVPVSLIVFDCPQDRLLSFGTREWRIYDVGGHRSLVSVTNHTGITCSDRSRYREVRCARISAYEQGLNCFVVYSCVGAFLRRHEVRFRWNERARTPLTCSTQCDSVSRANQLFRPSSRGGRERQSTRTCPPFHPFPAIEL